jgi:hypothetical protein
MVDSGTSLSVALEIALRGIYHSCHSRLVLGNENGEAEENIHRQHGYGKQASALRPNRAQ